MRNNRYELFFSCIQGQFVLVYFNESHKSCNSLCYPHAECCQTIANVCLLLDDGDFCRRLTIAHSVEKEVLTPALVRIHKKKEEQQPCQSSRANACAVRDRLPHEN